MKNHNEIYFSRVIIRFFLYYLWILALLICLESYCIILHPVRDASCLAFYTVHTIC